jgi:GTP:adenosylcobinamide-phosphate guanylyltransferase
MNGWTALLLAGSRPGTDPFAAAYGTDLKALIPICGVPMVARPATALLKSSKIDRIRVLAQMPDRISAALPRDPRLSVGISGPTIAATLEAVLGDPATRYPVLVTTADHALLSPEMIDDFCAKADGAIVAIGLVERQSLMKRLPQTKRTWLRFRGGAYSGANLFAFGSPSALQAVKLWRSVEQDRKKGWRMIAALGLPMLLGAVLRIRSLDQTLASMSRRLGISIRKVELGDPLAAVDVDRAADYDLVSAILEGRA